VPTVAVTAFISNTKNAKSYAIKLGDFGEGIVSEDCFW